jgi:hypothetical protein
MVATFLVLLIFSGVACALSVPPTSAEGSTAVSGILTADATWTKAGSPYIFTGAFGVASGVTLTIQAGATVELSSFYMQINGTLNAQGTNTDPIIIHGGANPSFTFTNTSSGVIQSTIVSNAAIETHDCSLTIQNCTLNCRVSMFGGAPQILGNRFTLGDGVVIYDADAVISGNVFTGAGQSIYVGSSMRTSSPIIERNLISNCVHGILIPCAVPFCPIIQNNTIIDNGDGISIWNGGAITPTIRYNNIYGNTQDNLHLTDIKVDIDAANNYWGTTDKASIAQKIYDYSKDFNLGKVTYEPYLTEANTQAMPDPDMVTPQPTQPPTSTPTATPEPTEAPEGGNFNIESNSTLSAFSFNSSIPEITFIVSGPDGTTGYVKATISKNFMPNADNINVYLDKNLITFNLESEGNNWVVTFTYQHSTHHVAITAAASTADSAELPSWVWQAAVIAVAVSVVAAVAVLAWMAKKPPHTNP